MTNHSPEPWITGMNTEEGSRTIVMATGVIVANCAPDWCEDGTPEPNARRIVACVNACRGMSTELLEEIAANPTTMGLGVCCPSGGTP